MPSSNSLKMLNELIESSKNLPTTSSDLGSIQLSVNEIRRRANELRSVNQDGNGDLTKAHYLLAGSGLAIEDVDTNLKKLQESQNSDHQLSGIPAEGEIDRYLRSKKDQNIVSSIEKLLSNSARDFDNFINKNVNLDWKEREYEVGQSFGLYVKRKDLSEVQNSLRQDTFKAPTWGVNDNKILNKTFKFNLNINENYLLRSKFERYAKIIHSFNNARQQNNTFPLNNEIITMIIDIGDGTNRQILESWKIIQNVKENGNIVVSSKRYLEQQFMNYVDTLYKKNQNEGLPTSINKVKSFIESKLKGRDNKRLVDNLTIVNGIPIWALIFYLLRAGLHQEALEVAINNQSSFNKVEKTFLTYFKAFVALQGSQLPVELTTKLHIEYNQHIKSALDGDPYRMAVYKIIGRCDLSSKSIASVTLSVEDWVWFHLMLVKDDVSDMDPVYEKYKLEDFQNRVLSYGINHFSDYYLQILLLSGLYEPAVEHAYNISKIDGVHIAIGLANKHLLNTTACNESNDDSLVFSRGTKLFINFARLLGIYTESFRLSDPRIAAEYLVLIGLTGDEEQIKLSHEALRELTLETREFAILLGKINTDGTRIPGVIEERRDLLHLNEKREYLNKIAEQAALRAEEEGRVQDCLILYQLAEKYDVVVSLVNDLLGDLLSNPDISNPLIDLDEYSNNNPIIMAENLIHIYMNNLEISKKIHAKNKETNLMLLHIVEIRRLFDAKQWQNTLNLVEEINLIPFSNSSEIRRSAQEVLNIDSNILKNIPNLLIIIMTCVYNIFQNLGQSTYQSAVKEQQIAVLKNIAKNCTMYAGMLQYKMSRDVYSQLTKLEITLQ